MSYYDDEAAIALLEDYDDESFYEDYDDEDYDDESFYEDYDDEDYDDEGLAENEAESIFRRRRRRYNRRPTRIRRARPAKARRLSTGVRGIRRATLQTPAGRASIRLPMAVVTKEELKKSLAKVGIEIRQNAEGIKRLDSNIRKVDQSSLKRVNGLEGKLSKFEKSTNKKIDEAKQQAILPLLLQSKPKPKSAILAPAADQTGVPAGATKVNITNAEYESDDNTLLLLVLLGGFSGGGSGGLLGGGSNLLPLLLLSDALK